VPIALPTLRAQKVVILGADFFQANQSFLKAFLHALLIGWKKPFLQKRPLILDM